MTFQSLIRRVIHWSFTIVTLVTLITGLGITEFRTIEFLTFGVLTKPLSFKIHTNLIVLFVILLILHIYFSMRKR